MQDGLQLQLSNTDTRHSVNEGRQDVQQVEVEEDVWSCKITRRTFAANMHVPRSRITRLSCTSSRLVSDTHPCLG